MVDAVTSGGYGMLGLYAAQAPVVPAPPPPAATAAPADGAALAVVPVEPAKALGSGPVPGGDPGAGAGAQGGADGGSDGKAASGQAFSSQGQALARQAAVAVSLAGGPPAGGGSATAARPAGQDTAEASPGRASRAYARTRFSESARPAGAMFSAKA
ncbi:hypothetical protein DFW101_2150 [Solidesulfovibrio carbinoliphilus subsp. oakridgensis]|uniref:Uncharacterized protein n=2 Tax=Solidesulfovibrio carbinoliphilus TaxID=345370 RepID=G7Q9B3_9BACT|nr:hypothetical protein DFW101_2150 [Solidesulfovibrio carbinoliphilus subsp. oakridgensis]